MRGITLKRNGRLFGKVSTIMARWRQDLGALTVVSAEDSEKKYADLNSLLCADQAVRIQKVSG
jgi:hypothetical protein